MGIISPGIGVNIENNWNHPPSDGYELISKQLKYHKLLLQYLMLM